MILDIKDVKVGDVVIHVKTSKFPRVTLNFVTAVYPDDRFVSYSFVMYEAYCFVGNFGYDAYSDLKFELISRCENE